MITYRVAVAQHIQVVVGCDPDWPIRFEAERGVLERALAPWLEGGIHHVGSTAVPGLSSKPVIDMLAGVTDLESARDALEPLRVLGYRPFEHRPDARAFVKGGSGGWWEESHHLHLTLPGSPLWIERLAFRDALRADPALATAYASWKRANAASARETGPYEASKFPFVRDVLDKARITLEPDASRLSVHARERSRP